MQTSAAAPNLFGLGSHTFGDSPVKASDTSETVDKNDEASDAESEASAISSSDESLVTAMASTIIETSPWVSSPRYPPLYLSTTSEYVPPPPKQKLPLGVKVTDPADDDVGEGGKKANWAFEAYENSLDVDQIFDRFTQRVGYEGEQCVR